MINIFRTQRLRPLPVRCEISIRQRCALRFNQFNPIRSLFTWILSTTDLCNQLALLPICIYCVPVEILNIFGNMKNGMCRLYWKECNPLSLAQTHCDWQVKEAAAAAAVAAAAAATAILFPMTQFGWFLWWLGHAIFMYVARSIFHQVHFLSFSISNRAAPPFQSNRWPSNDNNNIQQKNLEFLLFLQRNLVQGNGLMKSIQVTLPSGRRNSSQFECVSRYVWFNECNECNERGDGRS